MHISAEFLIYSRFFRPFLPDYVLYGNTCLKIYCNLKKKILSLVKPQHDLTITASTSERF